MGSQTTQNNTNAHFVNAMEEIRAHAKAGPGTPSPLEGSTHCRALLAAWRSAAPPSLADITSDVKNTQQGSLDAQQAGAEDAVTALQSDKDRDRFEAKMDAQRAQAKRDSDAILDRAYAKLTQLGQEYPDQQSQILLWTIVIGRVLTGVLSTQVSFLGELSGKADEILRGALKDPMQFVEGGFTSISALLGGLP